MMLIDYLVRIIRCLSQLKFVFGLADFSISFPHFYFYLVHESGLPVAISVFLWIKFVHQRRLLPFSGRG